MKTKFFSNIVSSHKYLILLVIILVLGLFLRFYNYPNQYGFDGDAINDQIVAYVGAQQLQLPITGSFSSAGAFTFGPWYYYHIILFQLLTHNMYSAWVTNGFLSIVMIFVMYKFGEEVFDKKLGVILAFLTMISPAQDGIGITSSNPNIVPLYAAIFFWSLVAVIKKKRSLWWCFLMGASLGIAINAHYQALMLLVLVPFLILCKNNKLFSFLIFCGGLFLVFLPLIFFNLLNHWSTLLNFIYFYEFGKNTIYVPNSWTIYVRDFLPLFAKDLLGLPAILSGILLICISYFYALNIYKRKISLPLIISLLFLTLNFFYLRYYWGERHSNYLYYLHPFIFLVLGYMLYDFLSRKYVRFGGAIILVIILFFSFKQDISPLISTGWIHTNSIQEANSLIKEFPNQKFTILACGKSDKRRANTLSYLLDLQGKLDVNNGKQIAFASSDCNFPYTDLFLKDVPASSGALLKDPRYTYLKSEDSFDFSSASVSAIQNAGWQYLTPQAIYDSKVKWWYDEKP